MPEQPINKPKYNASAGNACVVRWREYAHGGRARVAATVALVWQRHWFCPLWQQRWTTASKEAIPSRAGELGGSVGHEHRTFGWLVVPHAVQRVRCCPGACAPAVLCGARLRSGVRVVTAAERRCARTAPCIGNEIDRYHKALICQLSIYYYLLHNSIGLLLSAHILLLSTSPTTEPARFPTVVIPRISRHSSVYTC